jgi:hypothetical protein
MPEEPPIIPRQAGPPDPGRPLSATEDLRIPRQTRRSWALEDLD